MCLFHGFLTFDETKSCTKFQETAATNGVSAMPTFLFFRNKVKIDSLRGADPGALEEKIKKWYSSGDDDEEESAVKGYVSAIHMLSNSYQNVVC